MSRVDVEVRGAVAWLTMSNPGKANARDAEMRAALTEAFRRSEADASVRVIVLTGEGERAFSAGGDITAFPDSFEAGLPLVREALRSFVEPQRATKPVVAAVNGAAIGGGTELTLGCDHVVAADSATFALPEAALGILPPYGIVRLCNRVGELDALELLMSGRTIDAAEAARIGLVNSVVRGADLHDAAQRVAEGFARQSASSLAAVKAVLAARDVQQLELAAAMTAAMFTTVEAKERIAAHRSRHGTPRVRS